MTQYLLPWAMGALLASRLMTGRFLRLVLVVAAPLYVMGPLRISLIWPILVGIGLGVWMHWLERIAPRMAAALTLFACMRIMGEIDTAFISLGGAVLVAAGRAFFDIHSGGWHRGHALAILMVVYLGVLTF